MTEGVDSSATDSGTEDVLSSQMLSDPVHHPVNRDDRQPRQYKTKTMVSDGDWLTQRNAHQNKVMLICLSDTIQCSIFTCVQKLMRWPA